jgi:hypothetical protein
MEKNKLAIPNEEIAKQLNLSVISVISSEKLLGFEKSYLIAKAVTQLKELLTAEYMKPIMELQGNRLGFKTDKDTEGGYSEAVVKNCLIEAVLMGVQPFGNQFNIIANNSYITKEGFGYLLLNYEGLYYEITPELPRINADKTSAAIVMVIEWTIDGITKTKKLDIPVRMNQRMGTDAVIGKATRKARAWLYSTITGSEMPEGDTQDTEATVLSSKVNPDKKDVADSKETERIKDFINNATTVEQLDGIYENVPDGQMDLFLSRKEQLSTLKK